MAGYKIEINKKADMSNYAFNTFEQAFFDAYFKDKNKAEFSERFFDLDQHRATLPKLSVYNFKIINAGVSSTFIKRNQGVKKLYGNLNSFAFNEEDMLDFSMNAVNSGNAFFEMKVIQNAGGQALLGSEFENYLQNECLFHEGNAVDFVKDVNDTASYILQNYKTLMSGQPEVFDLRKLKSFNYLDGAEMKVAYIALSSAFIKKVSDEIKKRNEHSLQVIKENRKKMKKEQEITEKPGQLFFEKKAKYLNNEGKKQNLSILTLKTHYTLDFSFSPKEDTLEYMWEYRPLKLIEKTVNETVRNKLSERLKTYALFAGADSKTGITGQTIKDTVVKIQEHTVDEILNALGEKIKEELNTAADSHPSTEYFKIEDKVVDEVEKLLFRHTDFNKKEIVKKIRQEARGKLC